MRVNITILGKGNVGSALAGGIEKAGYPVRAAGHDPTEVRETVAWGDLVVLAVPFTALDEVIETAGDALAGKIVVDATNALDDDMNLALGYSTSGAEVLQEKIPDSGVVKAFNTVFAQHMSTGRLDGRPLTAFVAGDDAKAKSQVAELADQIGFEAVDAGPLHNARYLEPLGFFNIHLGYVQGLGPGIGFSLLRG